MFGLLRSDEYCCYDWVAILKYILCYLYVVYDLACSQHHEASRGNKYPYRWVRGGRACLSRLSKNTRRTYRCSQHHEASYPRRSKSLQQTTDAHLLLRQKNQHDHVNACMSWQLWCNASYSKLSGIRIPTHTYMVQVVLLNVNLNVY
jgi:hypothetical protein